MTGEDERKVLDIIDRLTEQKTGIPVQEILESAKNENIKNPEKVIESLISQGLIMELPGNKICKIVKRLFW